MITNENTTMSKIIDTCYKQINRFQILAGLIKTHKLNNDMYVSWRIANSTCGIPPFSIQEFTSDSIRTIHFSSIPNVHLHTFMVKGFSVLDYYLANTYLTAPGNIPIVLENALKLLSPNLTIDIKYTAACKFLPPETRSFLTSAEYEYYVNYLYNFD